MIQKSERTKHKAFVISSAMHQGLTFNGLTFNGKFRMKGLVETHLATVKVLIFYQGERTMTSNPNDGPLRVLEYQEFYKALTTI